MSSSKKGVLISLGIGIVMLLIAAVIFIVTVKIPKYTATIQEIKTSYESWDDNSNDRVYKERVVLTYTDSEGQNVTDDDVLIKRDRQKDLPGVGDTVTVVHLLFGAREHSLIGPIAGIAVLLILGLYFLIPGPFIIRKYYMRQNLKPSEDVKRDGSF